MRRFALPLLAVAIALVTAKPVAAQEAPGEEQTITATVIDLSCSIVSDQSG